MSTPTHVRALRNAPVRKHWTNARSQFASALETAAMRALADPAHSFDGIAHNTSDVLAIMANALVCRIFDGVGTDLALYAWTADVPAILKALRHELLCGRSRHEWTDADTLQVVTAIEQLSVEADNDAAVQFAQQFSGRDAQRRLVEVAHDMRSPLGAILFLVERMQSGRDGPVNGALQEHLALVYSAAFGLTTMANDLMDAARGGSRLVAEPPRAFSVSDVLRSVRDVVQPVAVERRLSLRFSSPANDHRVGLESALQRVLLNLTTNALKFTTVGSVTVEVRQCADPAELLFVVEDTGRGLQLAELAEVSAAISSLQHAKPVSYSTDGLGLALCRKLVSAMGGDLAVESRAGEGTRFSFRVRLPAV